MLACAQALLLGESREVTRQPHAQGDVSARGGERKVFSFSCFPLARAFSNDSLRSPLEMESLSLSKKI